MYKVSKLHQVLTAHLSIRISRGSKDIDDLSLKRADAMHIIIVPSDADIILVNITVDLAS